MTFDTKPTRTLKVIGNALELVVYSQNEDFSSTFQIDTLRRILKCHIWDEEEIKIVESTFILHRSKIIHALRSLIDIQVKYKHF